MRDTIRKRNVTSDKSDLSTSVLESRGNGNNTRIRANHKPNDNIPGEKGLSPVQSPVCMRIDRYAFDVSILYRNHGQLVTQQNGRKRER